MEISYLNYLQSVPDNKKERRKKKQKKTFTNHQVFLCMEFATLFFSSSANGALACLQLFHIYKLLCNLPAP